LAAFIPKVRRIFISPKCLVIFELLPNGYLDIVFQSLQNIQVPSLEASSIKTISKSGSSVQQVAE
jgi:hypothetical protein